MKRRVWLTVGAAAPADTDSPGADTSASAPEGSTADGTESASAEPMPGPVPSPPPSTGTTTVHQGTAGTAGTSGTAGTAEAGDAMGWSIPAGDFDADGYADVLTGAPNEDITRDGAGRADAGAVRLLRGSPAGHGGTGSLSCSQDTAGVPGAAEMGDRPGSSVPLTDFSGHGRAHLLIGAEGEDAGNGTLLHLPSTASGVSVAGAVYHGVTQPDTAAGTGPGAVLTP